MAHHAAPGGSSYNNIFHAGNQNLILYASSFPYQNTSATVPPFYTTEYPEQIDPTTKKPVMRPDLQQPVTDQQHAERREYEGLVANQSGSECERIVFQHLQGVVDQQPSDAILVLHDFQMNYPKLHALSIDVPITLKELKQFIEKESLDFQADFLVLVKNVGIILIEVKRSYNQESIDKSNRQLASEGSKER